MNKSKKLLAVLMLSFCMSIAGCSSGNVEQFASDAAGAWHRHGNLQDELLEVRSDGTWIQQNSEEGLWTPVGKGTIGYNKDYKSFEFINEMSNRIYLVGINKNGVLNFGYDFYRAEVSVDGFGQYDGFWYLSGSRDDNYFLFDNGKWNFFEAQGMGHVSVDSGYLVWDGNRDKLMACEYPDTDPFAVFSVVGTDEIKNNTESYMRMEDLN